MIPVGHRIFLCPLRYIVGENECLMHVYVYSFAQNDIYLLKEFHHSTITDLTHQYFNFGYKYPCLVLVFKIKTVYSSTSVVYLELLFSNFAYYVRQDSVIVSDYEKSKFEAGY